MDAQSYIGGYVAKARAAQAELESYTQEQADRLVREIAKTVYENAEELSGLAVSETGMGNVPDKIAKCRSKASVIWNSLRGKPSVGVISRDPATGITKIAKPVGVVAALTPVTENKFTTVVFSRDNVNEWLSVRNIPTVHPIFADQLNTYDVVTAQYVVFTKEGLEAFVDAKTKPAAKEA